MARRTIKVEGMRRFRFVSDLQIRLYGSKIGFVLTGMTGSLNTK